MASGSSNNTPYSLAKPPNAPKKKRSSLAERRIDQLPSIEEKADWHYLRDCGWVRHKFLRYDPDDAEEIHDLDLLTQMLTLYNPQSQPINVFEQSYIDIMREAIEKRLHKL